MATQALLERRVELNELGRAMRSARAGAGRVVVVTGTAGTGKTALLEEARRRWSAHRLRASCSELERGLGFGAARQLLEPALRSLSVPRQRELFAEIPDRARQVLTGSGVASLDGAEATVALFQLLVRLSSDGPVLLTVDDAQWADAPSLRWLHYVHARASELPILILVAVRSTVRPELPDDMCFPGARRVGVRPLSVDAIARLARVRLDVTVDRVFVRRCARLTGGIPLYLSALLDEVAAGAAPPDTVDLDAISSATITSGVRRRLAALPPAATRYAEALSVLETRHWLDVAREMAALDTDEAVQSWSVLVDLGLLTNRTDSGVVHPIVLSSIRDSLVPSRRMQLHAAAARALRGAGAAVEVVATHLLHAAPGAVADAGAALIDAAGRSAGIGAPESAAAYLERALEERLDRPQRRTALLRLGQAQFLTGSPSAKTNLEQAVRLSMPGGERADAVVSLATVQYAFGETRSAVDALLDESERLPSGPAHDAVLDSAVQMMDLDLALRPYAVGRLRLGRPCSPVDHVHRAVELSIAGDDRLAAIEHLHTALRTDQLLEIRPQYATLAAFVCMICGEYELTRTISRRLCELSVRRGAAAEAAMAGTIGAYALTREGWLREAHQQLSAAWAVVRDSGLDVYVTVVAEGLADCLRRMGRVKQAAAALDAAPANVPIRTVWHATSHARRGQMAAATGSHQDAVDALRTAGEALQSWGLLNPMVVPWRSLSAGPLLALGRRDITRKLVADELSLARQWGAPEAVGTALLALSRADAAAAPGALGEALDTLADAPCRPLLIECLVEEAARLRRGNARARARPLLRQALALAHDIGAETLAHRAWSELWATGSRPRPLNVTGVSSLTRGERRVVDLAVEGQANKQIALTLRISVKTVETHLSSAYRKLGTRGRGELAIRLG